VETDLIPPEMLVPVVFHHLKGPLVSIWKIEHTLGLYVSTAVKETTVYPSLISKADAQVCFIIYNNLHVIITYTLYYIETFHKSI
jgi:hypothetical protein